MNQDLIRRHKYEIIQVLKQINKIYDYITLFVSKKKACLPVLASNLNQSI